MKSGRRVRRAAVLIGLLASVALGRPALHLGLTALGDGTVHRNQLLGEPVEVFENRSAGSTDILHEYFLPAASFEG